MGQFNQGGRSWGSRDNNRGGGGFGGGGGGGFRDRDRARPQMHRATCADCGNPCEVPFKPTGEKPVYCSNCFEGSGRAMSKPKREHDGPRFDRPRFDDRPKADNSDLKEQLSKLDVKLDRILKALAPIVSAEPAKVSSKPAKEPAKKAMNKEVKEDVEKPATKKATAKKSVTKKKAAKKK